MIDYKTVGLRIRAVRQEKKLTQEKLAEAAGVGVTHISHIALTIQVSKFRRILAA